MEPNTSTKAAEKPQSPAETLEGQDTLSGGELRDAEGESAVTDVEPAAAVKGAAKGQDLSPEGQSQALKWFMATAPDASVKEVKVKKLNFGTSTKPEWVEWKVRPIGLDVLRGIRKKAANTREARRTGTADEYLVNLQIVVAATVDPDIKEASRLMYEQGIGPNDPVENLRTRFQGKPGYITQLAGEILSLSGFNEDDVTDADALEAAKNS